MRSTSCNRFFFYNIRFVNLAPKSDFHHTLEHCANVSIKDIMHQRKHSFFCNTKFRHDFRLGLCKKQRANHFSLHRELYSSISASILRCREQSSPNFTKPTMIINIIPSTLSNSILSLSLMQGWKRV